MIDVHLFTNKDFKLYEKTLSNYDEFNSLNEDFLGIYSRSSLFNKIQYKAGARLLFKENEPIVFIWCETRNGISKIRSIIPFEGFYDLSYQDLLEVIPSFTNALPIYLEISKFEYEMNGPDDHERILEIMGFQHNRGIITMQLDLSNLKESKEHIKIKHFKVDDVKKRVELQNKIFHSKYRIPINSTDILLEISKKSYLPNFAFFCLLDEEYIGFGQITKSKTKYYLVNFGIIPEYRGKGLSKLFLHEILNAVKKEAIQRLYLDVSSNNEPAVKIYRDAGFESQDSTLTWMYVIKDDDY